MPVLLGHRPTVESFSKSVRVEPLEKSILALISLLQAGLLTDPRPCAIATANLLSHAIRVSKASDVDNLRIEIAKIATRLVRARPNQPVIANITRRVLGLITDEAEEDRNGEEAEDETTEAATPSDTEGLAPPAVMDLSKLPISVPRRPPALKTLSSFSVIKTKTLLQLLSEEPIGEEIASGSSTPLLGSLGMNMRTLRTEVVEGIEEILDEISQAGSQIAAKSEQISPGESVLVYRPTPTVRAFLVKAAARRRFAVYVLYQAAEDKPEKYKDLTHDLAKHGIEVVHIFGSAAAVMTRLTRVVLDGKAVFANGAVIVDAGAANVATAARRHAKTVTVVSGVYRFSPEILDDRERYITWAEQTPSTFISGGAAEAIPTTRAVTECIHGSLVSEYITNLGVHGISSIPRIINEHYKPEDQDFVRWVEDSML